MTALRVVMCEDEHAAWMRPLSDGLPAWEIPVGMYSLRERTEQVMGERNGVLLTRPHLAGLTPQDGPWTTEWSDPSGSGRDLWLSSRFGAHRDVLTSLTGAAAQGRTFAWLHDDALVAASCPAHESEELAARWRAWLAAADERGVTPDAPLDPGNALGQWRTLGESGRHRLLGPEAADDLLGAWERWTARDDIVLGAVWDVVPAMETALARDAVESIGLPAGRRPYGLVSARPDPVWETAAVWSPLEAGQAASLWPGVAILGDESSILVAGESSLEPGVVVDVRSGPVIVGPGVTVQAGCRLEGPLSLGPGCRIKAGSRIGSGTALGIGCRMAGEVVETLALNFVNKQHDGFIGHAVLGSWINLGAMTTCSDLKNNYGEIRVDLGWGPVPTGRRFVGLMAGEHVRTAIGTLFNTGTVVGFGANVFGAGMPGKAVPVLAWGTGGEAYDVQRALRTARIVMERRDCVLTREHEAVFLHLARHS